MALSGGGIRSATYSLGAIQALAKAPRDALSKIDIVSSVSGGGYTGCFLRSLFVPDRLRGIAPKVDPDELETGETETNWAEIADQHDFARTVLASGPDTRDIEWEAAEGRVKRRNPLWWLREHSRYLAPNGPTDYVFALAYIARNWVAMIYIFLLASLAIFTAIVLGEALGTRSQMVMGLAEKSLPLSPLLWLALIPIALIAIHSIAYWITQAMSPNEPEARRQWRNLVSPSVGTVLGAVFIFYIAKLSMPDAFPPYARTLFVTLLSVGLVLMVAGVLTANIYAFTIFRRGPGLTSELRRRLTKGLANTCRLLVVVLAVAVVDTIGMWLARWFAHLPNLGSGIAALLPLLAYLIKKLPDWFGGNGSDKGKVAALFSRFLNTIALVAGIILFGMVAVAADAISHAAAWRTVPWSEPDWPRLLLVVAIVWVLAVLSGTANGFINLSSLHALYSARLTRAYLGASNNGRLEDAATIGSSITETHSGDYIQPQIYCRADLPAPLHLINATINETIDPQSQLVARDRKGENLTLEPHGIRVANEPVEWAKVGKTEFAEQLSLGQWCSISGAAASSAMGRLTKLGLAMAFTFANVRLGYWWWSPNVCTCKTPANAFTRAISVPFGTFVYLFNEMTARYSRAYKRKYLTDGGHFENSGAYRLIQRRVPLILVADNGADPKYRFEDLENLVRKVRLDFGGEMQPLKGDELATFLSKRGVVDRSIFADPTIGADWRDQFTSTESSVFVIALRATFADGALDILWLKPRTHRDMPPDLMGYSASNPLFPQQPTGDQFFDEAQWESYRRLGELSMSRLLESCPRLLA